MLSPYRVLDLTDGRAALGPQMLADLGAEVVLVEPPGGSPERTAGTAFAAYNRNKRSVTLGLDDPAGRERFFELVRSADFLFENAAPGAMDARGLGFATLRDINPRLIYVAISPFGQDGPYRDFPAADLTLSALSGQMAIYGDADRPPVRMSVPQAWRHAAAESAVGALVALQRRLWTGEAQFVDVSAQAALVLTAVNATIAAAVQGKDFRRNGSKVQLGLYTAPTIFACADGYAVLFSQNLWPKLVRWMVEDGSVPASWLSDVQWATFFPDFLSGKPVKHSYDELVERAAAFVAKHPVQALFRRGLAEDVFIAPVNTLADVLAFDHLRARGYWQPLRLPDGREVRAPGPFVRAGATPIQYRRGVPQPGEANEALPPHEPAAPDRLGPAQPDAALLAGAGDTLPFAGLRVADFSWVGVGPLTAKYLADHGATTVRVETSQPPDILRVNGPFAGGEFGVNRSHFFGMFNSSKLSIALNLKHPAGKEVARRLIGWADVYLESFTPGTMAGLGLDYAAARAINPRIIMVSTCLMGQTGPAASLAGYGTHAAAISGFVEITGWPDRAPAGPYAAYTDLLAPRFLASSLIAALDHRRRTGEGQYIEQSQMEAALHFLAPELLEYQRSGTLPRRMGNEAPGCAPHSVYPCAGNREWGIGNSTAEDERIGRGAQSAAQPSETSHSSAQQAASQPGDEWIAIAVETDEQWRALRRVLGEPAWARNPALETAAGRWAARQQIDAELAAWTRTRDRYALMHTLLQAGVPAGAVQRSSDLLRDPQLAHRRYFRPLRHPEMGVVPYEGHQFRMSGYDSGPRLPAPCLGEHTVEVLRDLLGMADEEIAEIAASGALV